MISRSSRLAVLSVGLVLGLSLLAVDYAEARRGGSFGSRGTRTFQSAPPTRTAPQQTAPVERTTTPNPAPNNPAGQPRAAVPRPGGFMNGFGGSLMRGLLLGGLIGVLMGQGFGGLAGMFGLLLQVVLIGGAILLALRFFRSRSSAFAGAGGGTAGFGRDPFVREGAASRESVNTSFFGASGKGSGSASAPIVKNTGETRLRQTDLDAFETRLTEVQEAFGREDHVALRRLTTPEMVSFLSEELADNAKKGVRNDVSDVRLLQADVAESWREGDQEYATAALRYASRDVTRDRTSGRLVEGDTVQADETTELWTFTRQKGADWKVSAIQQTT